MMLDLAWQAPTAVRPSPRVRQVAGAFGLGLDPRRDRPIVAPCRLGMEPGDLVFVTGPSGGGKSTLLRLIDEAVTACRQAEVLWVDRLPEPLDMPLVDALAAVPRVEVAQGAGPASEAGSQGVDPSSACIVDSPQRHLDEADLRQVMADLARVGLGDAFLMLRRPCELSDGQRARLRLAQAMAELRRRPAGRFVVLLADEFAAPLDRVTAAVLARQIRRWVDQMHAERPGGLSAVLATTHDDLLEALAPDVLVYKDLSPHVHVRHRERRREGGK